MNTFSSWEEISRAFKVRLATTRCMAIIVRIFGQDQDLQYNLRKSEPEFGVDMKFVHHAYCVIMQMV